MSKLYSDQEYNKYKPYLILLFELGGRAPKKHLGNIAYSQVTMDNAADICRILYERDIYPDEFSNLETDIKTFISGLLYTNSSGVVCNALFSETDPDTPKICIKPLSVDEWLNGLACHCQKKKIYFDDLILYSKSKTASSAVSVNISVQKVNTTFGKLLQDAGCYLSQHKYLWAKNQENPQGKTRNYTGAQTLSRDASDFTEPTQKMTKSTYKDYGPLSSSVIDLKGAPNDKIYLYGEIYAVGGYTENPEFNKKATMYLATIRPINRKYEVNGTNSVSYSSNHGNSDCTCYFDTYEDAKAFLIASKKAGKTNKIQFERVAAQPVDKNGYFKVGTEFGETYIRARKLNEAFNMEAKEEKTLNENVISESQHVEFDIPGLDDAKYNDFDLFNEVFLSSKTN